MVYLKDEKAFTKYVKEETAMKKAYEKPQLIVETFDIEDIITMSGLDTVNGGKGGMEQNININDLFPW